MMNTYFTNSTAVNNGGAIHTANITNSHFANNNIAQLIWGKQLFIVSTKKCP